MIQRESHHVLVNTMCRLSKLPSARGRQSDRERSFEGVAGAIGLGRQVAERRACAARIRRMKHRSAGGYQLPSVPVGRDVKTGADEKPRSAFGLLRVPET